ncbi:FecR family protein [Sphingobacterium chuzhouense]|uniref:FecR domain-containing protein n=1 Tax=Sphingobacterium chuzhouense TaxID=1742264 RepID=A0ABR7XTB1_9SPHI|nr:FecR family protein [Sphingobacterium chuzhouense]MBD1422405.1 FecR domain-containing protein [Sphingobacterium chuzhouense]
MDKQQLNQAIDRICKGTADDADFVLYNTFCRIKQDKGIPLSETLLNQKKVQIFEHVSAEIIVQRRRRLYFNISKVAASVLVCLLFSIWLWNGDQVSENHEYAEIEDIQPGKSAGVLVLADGRKIDLQSTGIGTVSDATDASIVKTSDSTLQYKEGIVQSGGVAGTNMLITDRGQQYQLVLPDGTKVWLNAASTLTFPSSFHAAEKRKVQLEGEAYFEVAKDTKKPFIVETKDQKIRVYGTHFNVSSYADEGETRTTLLEGSVGINSAFILKPGQQLKTDAKGMSSIESANISAAIAWRMGFFEFDDENIYQIMRKLSRWYSVEVIYKGQMPNDVMKGTISKFENISKVLTVIEQTELLKFEIKDRTVIVTKR